ncbi:hypothetical protein [Bacteroides pyogenes]|uniref:hypothetical protein n=1 Tax=Bacteroides pyogenes TaxID=310300 RepID=UPI001F3065D5|nr:hypothetical protein [Bacteroides pyogenes]MCE9105961.1 hypothetical protein [Bacteroides pyogenes]
MINAIINNPYRILGIFSNSPKKDLVANKGKIQAFLRVNKVMPFKLDLQGILPPVERTQTSVDNADSELTLVAGQVKHAQFWFINKTPIDNIAFNHLYEGNIDTAMEFWRKSSNLYSLQNLFVCYLIKGDAKTAISNCAIPLYEQYSNEFVNVIDEKASFSSEELIQNIISTLVDAKINLLQFADGLHNAKWKEFIQASKVEPLISNLNAQIAEARKTKDKSGNERLTAGTKLKISSKPILDTLRGIISSSDTRYQIIADKVAQEVLQCSIDYYNDTKEVNSPAKALPLCEYALSIAIGNAAKQRCQENHSVIKEAYENMPPEEVAKEALEISNLLVWYRKQRNTSKMGLELLEKAQQPLVAIKEALGNKHSYYLETSSVLASAALGYVIDEVNDAQKEDKPNPFDSLLGKYSQYSLFSDMLGSQERRRQKALTLKAALRDAWQTIVYIDLLDTTDDFKKNRYQPNRKTLHTIIINLKGFDYPDDNYIIKGCAYNVSADKKFFWSDSEYFNNCKNKSDYKQYLEKFPSGKHAEKAKVRITEIEEHDKKVTKYTIIAVVVAIILQLCIILSANAMSVSKPSNGNRTPLIEHVESNFLLILQLQSLFTITKTE